MMKEHGSVAESSTGTSVRFRVLIDGRTHSRYS
jgi:hypothetical protein